jgi:hypothetical protein
MRLASLNLKSTYLRKTLINQGRQVIEQTREALEAQQNAEEFESKLHETQSKQKGLERDQNELKILLASLQDQRADLQRQSVTLKAQVDFLKDQAREYEEQAKKYGAVAAGDVGLPVSVTLAARILPPHQSVEQVRQALAELLHDGEENLPALLNIPEGEGNTQPPRLRFKEQTGDLRGRSLLEDKANLFADKDDPISVRLLPERNFLIGERDIAADIAYVVVHPALPEGAELAVGTVDGSTGDAKIFNFLLNLTDAGKVYAERAGIQPARAPSAPEFYVRGTNELVFETLRKIAAIKRPVRVHMLAAEDLSTVDQLKVKFELGDTETRTGTSH